jgi:hypothetical protein
MFMWSVLKVPFGTKASALILSALLVHCFGPGARADLILSIAAEAGANIEFKGSGTGAAFFFNNNELGQGFEVSGSTGVGDSVGLFGTLGGTYSFATSSIVTAGSVQTAAVASSGGSLTITDSGNKSLTGSVAGIDVTSVGTGGAVNLNGAINLTNISYSGVNADLMQLKDEATVDGGLVTISFQFLPAINLTALAAGGADVTTSYSGTIATMESSQSVPEPSTLVLGCISLLGGYGLWRRNARGARTAASPSPAITEGEAR